MVSVNEEQTLKERLERERKQLLEEIGQLDEILAQQGEYHEVEGGGVSNHMADDASDTFEQEKYVALRRNLERILDQVNHALHKFELGTYGLCENCNERIPQERLEALPYANLCIKCQSKEEDHR
ncbi:MAG: TraR/DksA C4-type zinc finger protein [Chloroflexi bacterium]|nr:TraR/DksA C4-type zinc finger protein [Chloroflexota bacterium]